MRTIHPDASTGVAYLLGLACIFEFCGIHRFYARNPLSGCFWLFTHGLLGFGQLLDLLLIPGIIAQASLWATLANGTRRYEYR